MTRLPKPAARSTPEESCANLGKGDELLFDFPAQATQVEHAIPRPGPIEKGALLIVLGLLFELGQVGNDFNGYAIGRTPLDGCLPLVLAR